MGVKDSNYQIVYRGEVLDHLIPGQWVFFHLDLALPFIGGKSFIGPGLIKSYPFIICWAVITVIYYAIYAKKKKIS
ncbi:hypothetical protein QS265_23445 [Escherichia coli]|nr:hypothetical protein [Escherichia coli]